ncbi:MAG: transcriptional regulator [Mesorhizobium sp.]|uniref:type IV toxin-antitoxin system AbiEi family antitoxin domain-containing protein n=1 Tax=Mesorhizobium sp. TaxID=1871066 RepID=UPI000FEA71D6|nr:type IV toxin-antitoxin system AbiEi family antitoxin [Mesorhizobium sp.]RWH58158.1 MAG: transcriptional regulator [Mesorhizobium sp.]
METNLRTLGKAESKVVLSLREEGRSLVQTADIFDILGPAVPETAARKVIRNLVRKGWLSRIVGGKYMLLPPEHGPENLGENNVLALASAVAEPSYIGWWSAASWHGFTTQKPMTVFVAVTRQIPQRVIEGSVVRFVKVTARKFFGYESYNIYGRIVALSTPAKTLVDCLDRPDLAGGPAELARIVHGALGETDPQDVLAAATAMKSRAVAQRLGFLSDLVGRPLPERIRAELRALIPGSYRSYFGRAEQRGSDIGYVAAWGLFVHAREADMLAEVPRIHGQEES